MTEGKVFFKDLPAESKNVIVLVMTWEDDNKSYYQFAQGTYKELTSENKITLSHPVSMNKTVFSTDNISKIIESNIDNLKRSIDFCYKADNPEDFIQAEHLFDNEKFPWYSDDIRNLHNFYKPYKDFFDLVEEKTSCKEVKDFISLYKEVNSHIIVEPIKLTKDDLEKIANAE